MLDIFSLEKMNINLPNGKIRNNLSSGVNHLGLNSLYTKYAVCELNYQKYLMEYSPPQGNKLLLECIRFYEQRLAYLDGEVPANAAGVNFAVTSGASAAIMELIDYFSLYCHDYEYFFLGMNYFLFFQLMKQHGIQYSLLEERGTLGTNLPTVEQVIKVLSGAKKRVVVFVTLPANPSGETYNEAEFSTLIRYLKRYKESFLVLDKCQQDEITPFPYINYVGAIAKEAFEKQTVVINSFSKVRGIPGIRMGYVFGTYDIIDYITLKTKYTYYNHTQFFVFPIIADLLLRLTYLWGIEHLAEQSLCRSYKMLLARNADFELFVRYLRPMMQDVIGNVYQYQKEVLDQYQIILCNYNYLKTKLDGLIQDITRLDGGINTCVKFTGFSSNEQLIQSEQILQNTGILMMPECYFNGAHVMNSNRAPWYRITLAHPYDRFVEIIDSLQKFLLFTYKLKRNEEK